MKSHCHFLGNLWSLKHMLYRKIFKCSWLYSCSPRRVSRKLDCVWDGVLHAAVTRTFYIADLPAPGIKLCTNAGYRLLHSHAQVLTFTDLTWWTEVQQQWASCRATQADGKVELRARCICQWPTPEQNFWQRLLNLGERMECSILKMKRGFQ